MTFPFSFHENFESGGKGAFDSESDSGNRLDFPGPDQLEKGLMDVFPHRGAYCMRVNLGKNSTNAYVEEGVSWAADSTNYVSFKFMVGEDVQIGNDGDLVEILDFRAGGSSEGSLVLARVEPAGMVLGIVDAGSTSVLNYLSIELGDWLCVEVQVDVDAGVGNDGSIIVRVGDDQIRIGNLDQAAIDGLRFGANDQTGDFKGHIYFDEVIIDTARLHQDYGPHNLKLDGETFPLFKSGWVFVGEGTVMGLELVDGGSNDCVMKVYDTAELSFSEAMKKGHLATASGHPVDRVQALGDTPLIQFDYGCYVALSGTNPSAFVRIGKVDEVWDDEDEDDADEG